MKYGLIAGIAVIGAVIYLYGSKASASSKSQPSSSGTSQLDYYGMVGGAATPNVPQLGASITTMTPSIGNTVSFNSPAKIVSYPTYMASSGWQGAGYYNFSGQSNPNNVVTGTNDVSNSPIVSQAQFTGLENQFV